LTACLEDANKRALSVNQKIKTGRNASGSTTMYQRTVRDAIGRQAKKKGARQVYQKILYIAEELSFRKGM